MRQALRDVVTPVMAWYLGYRQQKKDYRRDGEQRCDVVNGCGETRRFVQRSRDKGGGGGQDGLVRIEKQTHKSHSDGE